jgi:hypothetical protein
MQQYGIYDEIKNNNNKGKRKGVVKGRPMGMDVRPVYWPPEQCQLTAPSSLTHPPHGLMVVVFWSYTHVAYRWLIILYPMTPLLVPCQLAPSHLICLYFINKKYFFKNLMTSHFTLETYTFFDFLLIKTTRTYNSYCFLTFKNFVVF